MAIEQGYATAQSIVREGASKDLEQAASRSPATRRRQHDRRADVMAKERDDVKFVHAQMYYPVTDAAMDTAW